MMLWGILEVGLCGAEGTCQDRLGRFADEDLCPRCAHAFGNESVRLFASRDDVDGPGQ
jgi:hypothetical protein